MTLAARDALLSRLCGQPWPHGPLLDTLNLSPASDVLDVGAGDGGLLRELRTRGHTGRLVGVDIQPSEGVLHGDTAALPFPADAFDTVLFVRVLAHLPEARAALAEARRVLRPGGRLVVAAHGPDHLRATWAALGRAQAIPTPPPDGLDGPSFTVRPLDVRPPVMVTAADALALARSYGVEVKMDATQFPMQDELHLTGMVVTAGAARR